MFIFRAFRRASFLPILVWVAVGCATSIDPSIGVSPPDLQHPAVEAPRLDKVGLLLMAHGAGPEWNASVEASVADLRERMPVAVAFGMANPITLQASLDSLRERGVGTVVVVRLFVSEHSFLHQTEYLLALRDDPPHHAMVGHRPVSGSELSPLTTEARILLSRHGLAGSDEVARILLDRADSNSAVPAETGIVLVAHGMGAEDENQHVLATMEDGANVLRSHGYAEVQVATLREDWAKARAEAEREIRASVDRMSREHESVVVIPYRVSGFGPYAKVLEGLEYVPTEGLLPHPLVTEWVVARATATICADGLPSPLGPCK